MLVFMTFGEMQPDTETHQQGGDHQRDRHGRPEGHGEYTTTDTIYTHLYPSGYTKHVARFDAYSAAEA